MDNEFDEFDEEADELEQEVTVKKSNPKKKVEVKDTEVPTERYIPFFQEQRIGIVDTLTKEIIVELDNYRLAQLEAFKLNKLDKISTASGV